jgi:hypothetical protein
MSKEKNIKLKFENEAQEADYFDEHSPLDIVTNPKIEKIVVRGAKDRPITIRLDSETRSKLNILAAKQGVGPSTFARLSLISAIEHSSMATKKLSLDDIKNVIVMNLPQSMKARIETLTKSATLGGNPSNPDFLLLDQSQISELAELGSEAMSLLLAMYGIQVITPEHNKYIEVKKLVQSGTK